MKRLKTPALRMLEAIRRRAAVRMNVYGFNLRGEYRRAMAGPLNSSKEHLRYLRCIARSPRVRAALFDVLTVAKAQATP